MSLIRKHGAVLQAWACLDLVKEEERVGGRARVTTFIRSLLQVYACAAAVKRLAECGNANNG